MDFEAQREQLSTLCGEMESCGIEDFHAFIVGKWLLPEKASFLYSLDIFIFSK